MDTIIYLKMTKRRAGQKAEKAFCRIRSVKDGHGIAEGDQLLVVEIPDETKPTNEWIQELESYLQPFWGYSTSIETVADPEWERRLVRTQTQSLWRECWSYPPYSSFHRQEYCEYLMQKAMRQLDLEQQEKQLHIYVVGYADYIPRLLTPYLPRTDSLQLIMQEVQYRRAEALQPPEIRPEEYLDALSEEEGIAAACFVPEQIPQGEGGRLRLSFEEPAVVIDLSSEPGLLPEKAYQKICWIDMDGSEEKKRRLRILCPEISYFSMKEEWRRLDTERKNGYNTLVN